MIVREARIDDAASIARIHVESWRSTYRGIVPDAYLDGLSLERRTEFWRSEIAAPAPGVAIYVAADAAGQLAGFCSCGPNRETDREYDGELYAIYLLQLFQGRGLGQQLFLTTVARLAAGGYCGMMLWVLAENPACGFYLAQGGREIRRKRVEIGGASLEEVAYGWPDLSVFDG